MIGHVLVPIDDSASATSALDYAFENFPDAQITVLHVLDPADASDHIAAGGRFDEWYEGTRAETGRLFDRAERRAADRGTSVRTVEEIGDPARTILEYAGEEGFDQIVVGSHGRHGVARVLLGSVAETVVRRSSVPVVVVRGPETR
jgi:nucleotide-binding universal stress UspA family protein